MKQFLTVVLCLCLVGCSTIQKRMTKQKNENYNTVLIPYNGTIPEAKIEIRAIAKQMRLIEPKGLETENFMFLRHNILKASLITGIGSLGGAIGIIALAPATGMTKLGFFFDYEKGLTNITITEEVDSLIPPKRFQIADELRLKNLQLAKNAK